jgi:MFS family permease
MAKKKREASLKNVYALGLVSFFTDVSSEMCFSILPAFILSLPGGNRSVLGFIEGLAEALSYSMRAVSGVFSDMFQRRKILVLIGYAMSNIVKPLFSVVSNALDVLIIRVADRVGKGIRTSPRDALLSESVSEKRRGTAFGLHRTLDQTGAILGPALASALMIAFAFTPRDIFWLSFIPGTAALIVILFFVKETIGKPRKEFKLLEGVRTILKGRFLLLLVIVGIFSLGAFNFSFILVNAEESGITTNLIPLVYAAINVTHAAIAIPAGALSDRIGREKTLLLGYGVFFISAVSLLAPSKTSTTAFITALLYGIYAGVVETVQRALIPQYAESGLRGTAYGLYYLVVGFAFFGSNSIVGYLWETFNSTTAIMYSLTQTAISIILFSFFISKVKTS